MHVLRFVRDNGLTEHRAFSAKSVAYDWFYQADSQVQDGTLTAATLYFVPGKDDARDAVDALSDAVANKVELLEIDYQQRLKQLTAKIDFNV